MTDGTGVAGEADPRQRLRAEQLRLSYGGPLVVDGLDLEVAEGTVTSVIGPNGCGKSTLLRALGRLLAPKGGSVLLDGERIDKMRTREVAKVLGLLPQSPQAPEGLTVADLVARGRHPHQTWYRQWSSSDDAAITEALAQTGMDGYAERAVDQLSGGQRQRAWISMALAQGTELLLLDEPITYLDLAHQVEVLDLVRRLNTERRVTIVMVLHDLNLAARYSDRLIAMRDGHILADGAPGEVLTEQHLAEVFGLQAMVVPDPVAATPMVVPISATGVEHHPESDSSNHPAEVA
ncbi:iron complex transport system ATP-binding protein [Tamaricihabitans halophyticus]|uniref:Iron complex transport system ATP-binding protein n=1 Tax=Tamaricihabitans halophyticus TaxID=1262583 RepID=A0A4V2SV16_9PSEU|nr:ABC transporter ATP-binding protein [Tamaricihabitans halophyticus]TCP56716.1 iron complex transport system ATP-binding protein [Tamaricihabitans halophyticus]